MFDILEFSKIRGSELFDGPTARLILLRRNLRVEAVGPLDHFLASFKSLFDLDADIFLDLDISMQALPNFSSCTH